MNSATNDVHKVRKWFPKNLETQAHFEKPSNKEECKFNIENTKIKTEKSELNFKSEFRFCISFWILL